jgi:hypothetical protein
LRSSKGFRRHLERGAALPFGVGKNTQKSGIRFLEEKDKKIIFIMEALWES